MRLPSYRMPIAALALVGAIGLVPLTSCTPAPALQCFDFGRSHNIGLQYVPGTIASVRWGATICTTGGHLTSVVPYATMNKEGYGRTPQVDEAADSNRILFRFNDYVEGDAVFHAYNCAFGSFIGLFCSGNTHLHFHWAYTAPATPHGLTGELQVWEDGVRGIDIQS